MDTESPKRNSITILRRINCPRSKKSDRILAKFIPRFFKTSYGAWINPSKRSFKGSGGIRLRASRGFRESSGTIRSPYPQAGFSVGEKLQLSKIGNIKIKLHRELQGDSKTLSIKRENGSWYACFSCVVEPEALPALDNSVGIDVGLESYAVLSNREEIPNPRWYRRAQAKLRRGTRQCGAAN